MFQTCQKLGSGIWMYFLILILKHFLWELDTIPKGIFWIWKRKFRPRYSQILYSWKTWNPITNERRGHDISTTVWKCNERTGVGGGREACIRSLEGLGWLPRDWGAGPGVLATWLLRHTVPSVSLFSGDGGRGTSSHFAGLISSDPLRTVVFTALLFLG